MSRLVDARGNPYPVQASFGHNVSRVAASYKGTLANYTSNVITAMAAERQKRTSADRALDLYTNCGIAHGLLEGLLAEVVGTGLTPQPSPMVRRLGLDAQWAAEWNEKAFDWFEFIGLDPRCWVDAQRRLTIYGLQALAYFNWKLEGMAIFQIVYRPHPASPVSLRLLPIAPYRVRTPSDRMKEDIYDGIEVDDLGSPVAVYVAKPAQGGVSPFHFTSEGMTRIPVWDDKTGLPQVLMVTTVRNIAEYRADGVLTSVLKDIRDGEDFRDAALVKALINNLFAMFIEEDVPTGGSLSAAGTYAGGGGQTITNWSHHMQELEQGLIITGRPGQKASVIENKAPGPDHPAMLRTIHSGVGIATGRGRENLTREYESSYSASQMSNENAERFNDCERQVMADKFCQPWWMWMALEGIARSELPFPVGRDKVKDLFAVSRAVWMRPPARHIDKQKIATADDIRLSNGTTTYSDIYSERGQDWRARIRQAGEERKYIQDTAAELGLPPDWLSGGSGSKQSQTKEEPNGQGQE